MSNFGLVNSKDFPTKTSLKAAVASGLRPLVWDTSYHNPRGTIPIHELKPADVIIGPNALEDRKWYANFRNGKIV